MKFLMIFFLMLGLISTHQVYAEEPTSQAPQVTIDYENAVCQQYLQQINDCLKKITSKSMQTQLHQVWQQFFVNAKLLPQPASGCANSRKIMNDSQQYKEYGCDWSY